MRRVLWACWLTLSLTSVQADDGHYIELSTPELTVVSGASEARTRELAAQIATFRAAVEQSFGVKLTPAIPLRIYALGEGDWKRYAQPRPGIAGYFLAQPFASDLIFDAQDTSVDAHELMFHEYVHYILRTFWVGEVPPFLDEGLAEVLSSARFENGSVRIGPRHDHIRFLRRNEWLDFARLLDVKRHDPEYLDHALAPAFYAQAWATVYYAMAVSPAFGERMSAYLRELSAGGSSVQAAERLIGAVSAEANRDIATHIRKKRPLPVTRLPVIVPASLEQVRIRSLSAEETALALGALMLRLSQPAKAQTLFGKVLERNSGSARARVGQAWSFLLAGERSQAAAGFDALARTPDLDTSTRVALARGLFQVAAAESQESDQPSPANRERFAVARTLFENALDDESLRLEAVNGYVLTCLALEEYPEGLIELAQDAYRQAPRSSVLAVGLALLHELQGGKAAARKYWEEAARSSHTAPMRARVQAALEQGAED